MKARWWVVLAWTGLVMLGCESGTQTSEDTDSESESGGVEIDLGSPTNSLDGESSGFEGSPEEGSNDDGSEPGNEQPGNEQPEQESGEATNSGGDSENEESAKNTKDADLESLTLEPPKNARDGQDP